MVLTTNAKGGESIHNYRLAFDIAQNVKGDEYNITFLKLAGKIATEMGLEWGGSWTGFLDYPHMQWTGGLTLSDLQKGKMPIDKKLPWETISKPVPSPAPTTPSAPAKAATVVETVQMMIDNKIYGVKRILLDGRNYIELKSFEQAGYIVEYLEDKKIAAIRKG